MEHLVHKQWNHSTDLGPQKGLGSHGSRSKRAIRVDNVRVGGDVQHDHGKSEDNCGDADADPVYVCVGTGEGEHKQGGGHEESAPHHGIQPSLGILAVPRSLRVDLFVDGDEAAGEEDAQLESKGQSFVDSQGW